VARREEVVVRIGELQEEVLRRAVRAVQQLLRAEQARAGMHALAHRNFVDVDEGVHVCTRIHSMRRTILPTCSPATMAARAASSASKGKDLSTSGTTFPAAMRGSSSRPK